MSQPLKKLWNNELTMQLGSQLLRLLIFSTDPKFSGLARLPKMLKATGFEVAALCLPTAFLAKTRYLDRHFPLAQTLDSAKLLKQLVNAIQIWQPTLVIYGDEVAVAFGQHVIQCASQFSGLLPDDALKLLKSSLGTPQFFAATLLKHETLMVAHKLGLRAPAMTLVSSPETGLQFAEKVGYPVVLKKDFSWSGAGVSICQNRDELLSSLQNFLPRSVSPLKASIQQLLRRTWFPTGKVLSLQQFILGRTAMYPLVALDGEVLAGFAAVKELTCSETGPSSVIRIIDHAEMQNTAKALIKQFQFTGFASFDFLIEEKTGQAYLVECNPRPVPVCHLGALVGIDLGQSLWSRLRGETWNPPLKEPQEQLVALFPQEWKRDPSSPNLHQIYHDVPWDDPELLRAYVGKG
jgi:hypothetical protein